MKNEKCKMQNANCLKPVTSNLKPQKKRAPRNKEASVCTSAAPQGSRLSEPECKQVNYCLHEDRKVFLCMEGFFCKVRDEFKRMSNGKYEIGFYIYRKEANGKGLTANDEIK